MGRVYSGNIWDTPDDPRRVGGEDYQSSYSTYNRKITIELTDDEPHEEDEEDDAD